MAKIRQVMVGMERPEEFLDWLRENATAPDWFVDRLGESLTAGTLNAALAAKADVLDTVRLGLPVTSEATAATAAAVDSMEAAVAANRGGILPPSPTPAALPPVGGVVADTLEELLPTTVAPVSETIESVLSNAWNVERVAVRDYWKSKLPLDKIDFDGLVAQERARAFTVAHVVGDASVERIREHFERTVIKGGMLFGDWREGFLELVSSGAIDVTRTMVEDPETRALIEVGRHKFTDYHLRTVYRTNLATAYNAGMWRELQDPDVAGSVAFMEYVTAGDETVRPAHRVMDGFRAPLSDPVWQTWWPPNGFNCRCSVRIITKWEAETKSLTATPFPGGTPDDGFEANAGLVT